MDVFNGLDPARRWLSRYPEAGVVGMARRRQPTFGTLCETLLKRPHKTRFSREVRRSITFAPQTAGDSIRCRAPSSGDARPFFRPPPTQGRHAPYGRREFPTGGAPGALRRCPRPLPGRSPPALSRRAGAERTDPGDATRARRECRQPENKRFRGRAPRKKRRLPTGRSSPGSRRSGRSSG